MKYKKPPLSLEAQLEKLIQRGLVCTDRSVSLHYLEHLNYYRLAAYWLPFETAHISHTFQVGATFRDALSLYTFDRELRLLVLDAIERVEVSTRAAWAYVVAHRYGPHGYLEASCFKQKSNKWDHAVNTQKLAERARKSREAFMRHYYKKYDEALPPAWVAVEAMTLGELSKWYENLQHGADRNAIAHKFDLDETNFASFLHHLNSLDRPAMQSLTHNGCFCFLVTSRQIHPTQSLAPDCV